MRCLTVALGAFAALLASRPAPAAEAPRPSFLLLLADDLRWDCLGCTGHRLLQTPHIDRLAADGVLFRNAFVTTSICCISRASIITGRYARRHGVPDFSTALPAPVLEASFPAALKRAGYRTACFGKWGIGGAEPAGVFDVWDAWGGQGEFFRELDGKQLHDSEYLTRRVEQFLKSQPADQPFCAIVLYKSPHEPYQPDPRDAELFREDTIEPPRTYTERHFEALPEFIRASEGRTRALKGHPTPEAYQEFVKQYLRCIAGVDRSVGQIRRMLGDLGRDDNTVIVFSSDNGFFLGEHGLSHKWLMHEESIRVPLVIRDGRAPAARRNVRVDPLALNIDLAPTILDLAGVEPTEGTDGRSLVPLLEGAAPSDWRRDFFYEHHFHYAGRIPRTEGVRTADWKYITYFDVDPPYEELYDLARDPHEERNLASDPAHAEQLERLRARYREYVSALGPAIVPPGLPVRRPGQ